MGEYRFGVLGVLVGALYCMVAVDSVVQSAETRQQIIQRVNSTTVTIVAGSLDSTSARLVQDLGTALNDGEKQRILPVLGFDSAQNIADVLYLKGVDAGIVYADVLDAVHEDNFIPDINLTLQYIAELGTENIFIIAGKDIRDINDLAGKTVNFGAGAGDGYTPSALLFKSLGIDVKRTNLPHTVALKKKWQLARFQQLSCWETISKKLQPTLVLRTISVCCRYDRQNCLETTSPQRSLPAIFRT